MQDVRTLIVAFCATKVTLIDVMPEVVIHQDPHKKKRHRYQDMDTKTKKEEHSEDEQVVYEQTVIDIFDDLLARVDYVPGLAIKFCCQDGKEQTLAKVLDLFPNVAPDGTASRLNDTST